MGFCSKGLKNEFETAMVNEPSVFEPLKLYCTPFFRSPGIKMERSYALMIIYHYNILMEFAPLKYSQPGQRTLVYIDVMQ